MKKYKLIPGRTAKSIIRAAAYVSTYLSSNILSRTARIAASLSEIGIDDSRRRCKKELNEIIVDYVREERLKDFDSDFILHSIALYERTDDIFVDRARALWPYKDDNGAMTTYTHWRRLKTRRPLKAEIA